MLNQSFSADNFRRIFDYQNRKGIYLESEFFPEVEKLTSELKRCKYDFRQLKKDKPNLTTEDYQNKKEALNNTNESLKLKKEKLLTQELERVSAKVNSSGFQFPLKTIVTKSGKTAYFFEHEPCSYFASKQVQYNIKKLYKVKQGNRNEIVSQLKMVLGDSFPKIIIRTDIKEFYENISQEKLSKKINEEPLLTLSSKKIIWQILRDYKKLSGSDKGVPRGIGISAYLSELYLKTLDDVIRSHPDILYYARYVDDIVAVFIPNPAHETKDYLDFIRNEVSKLGLELHDENKTKSIDLKEPVNVTMEYLGYKFSFGNTETKLSLSKNKINRYKERLNFAFNIYEKNKKYCEKSARKIFVKRLRFLTANTRLLNNKRNALVGVFFSNSLANDLSSLAGLDKYLIHKISSLESDALKRRLSSMSFVDGFTYRRFFKYSENDLKTIVSAWKHD